MVSPSHLVEVFLNTLSDPLGFTYAISGNEPFHRIAVALLIVAAVVVMAQWHNIARCIASTFGYWYPVILRESVPQTSRSTANSATIPKVFKALLPILFREIGWQLSFNRSAMVGITLALFFVGDLPFAHCLCLFFGMISPPFSVSYLLPFGKAISVLFSPNSHLLFVFRGVLSFVCSVICFPVGAATFFMFVSLISIVGASAIKTDAPHFIASFSEKLKGVGKELGTSKTAVLGYRYIQHSVSLSLYHMMVSADGVICRRFRCTALADMLIIPQKGDYIHV